MDDFLGSLFEGIVDFLGKFLINVIWTALHFLFGVWGAGLFLLNAGLLIPFRSRASVLCSLLAWVVWAVVRRLPIKRDGGWAD
ncbi:hypothetical protein [Deinococcus cellulosilyticus]|uniref:Uncharacterized protein n=1 Tax=Deinococcus cellulosilyticus (strain DSM 18568 / NBRC 106333 / KACC 11606 / 5516J-15) TaxID=1223518 RepID=A0A511N4D5_DEIC1|nr:hypothetical protein [Deinococcus cellulosilyticus]GEM47702.1 hypothetical protein DC3_33370 [Deinococcus cellulosilyticus NBRC 106333 = KACC 11606]